MTLKSQMGHYFFTTTTTKSMPELGGEKKAMWLYFICIPEKVTGSRVELLPAAKCYSCLRSVTYFPRGIKKKKHQDSQRSSPPPQVNETNTCHINEYAKQKVVVNRICFQNKKNVPLVSWRKNDVVKLLANKKMNEYV